MTHTGPVPDRVMMPSPGSGPSATWKTGAAGSHLCLSGPQALWPP